MLPAAFEYRAPASLNEALAMLEQHGDEATGMGGGQSLIPLLKLRFSRPALALHIARVPDLTALERRVGDFATVAVAVQVELDGGKIAKAGIGLTAVGDRNIKAADAERHLHGKEPTDAVIAEAARLAAETAEPKDDARGSAAYKKDVVRVFVQRGLKTAVGRAREAR